jgi:hypothetical protein
MFFATEDFISRKRESSRKFSVQIGVWRFTFSGFIEVASLLLQSRVARRVRS